MEKPKRKSPPLGKRQVRLLDRARASPLMLTILEGGMEHWTHADGRAASGECCRSLLARGELVGADDGLPLAGARSQTFRPRN